MCCQPRDCAMAAAVPGPPTLALLATSMLCIGSCSSRPAVSRNPRWTARRMTINRTNGPVCARAAGPVPAPMVAKNSSIRAPPSASEPAQANTLRLKGSQPIGSKCLEIDAIFPLADIFWPAACSHNFDIEPAKKAGFLTSDPERNFPAAPNAEATIAINAKLAASKWKCAAVKLLPHTATKAHAIDSAKLLVVVPLVCGGPSSTRNFLLCRLLSSSPVVGVGTGHAVMTAKYTYKHRLSCSQSTWESPPR